MPTSSSSYDIWSDTPVRNELGSTVRYGAVAGVRTVLGRARTPGSMLTVTFFVTTSVALIGISAIEGVFRSLSPDGLGVTASASRWVKILTFVFAVILGLYFIWQRRLEWRVLALLGGKRTYQMVSTSVEVVVRCAVATVVAVFFSLIGYLVAAWAIRTAFDQTIGASPLPAITQLLTLSLAATSAAVVASAAIVAKQ